MGNVLSNIKFAEVAPSAAKGNPSVSVRSSGVLVSNAQAEALVGATSEGKGYFKIGSDDTGKIYLIPATAEDSNVVKATKNGAKFQFKQAEVFKNIGVAVKNRYAVTKETDKDDAGNDVDYFVLTPDGKSTEKEDEAPAA